MRGRSATDTHWYLRHNTGVILDPSVRQFKNRPGVLRKIYATAVRTGFLTKEPSKRAKELIDVLTWQTDKQMKAAITDLARRIDGRKRLGE